MVSTMNEDQKRREQISALVDGELEGREFAQAVQLAVDESGQQTWRMYHLVGDVLRSPELARTGSDDFLAGFRARLAQEDMRHGDLPALDDQPRMLAGSRGGALPEEEAANAAVFRWKMVAGLASLAAVVAVGWGSFSALQGESEGARLAGGASTAAPVAAATEAERGQVMIRDPRLDELIAAHKQYGGASALQMPADFLRNATFESPGR